MPDYGPLVIGVCLSATAVSGLFLVLRLYCKVDRSRGLWWDDYVLIAAWICLAVAAGLAVYDVTLGFGKDVSEVSLYNRHQSAIIGTVIGLFAVCAAAWSKTSFAMTILRLSLSRGWMTRLLWVLIISMNIIMGLVIVFSFVKCSPTAKVWDGNRPGRCWDPRVATYYNIFAGAYSGAMDLVLCVLAWVIIWKLQVSAREKIGVGIALTFGVFAAATAAVKCYRMLQLSSPNPTVAGVGIITWGLVESAVTIMAASIPMMRVLVLKCLRDEAERRSSSGSRSRKVRSRSNQPSGDTSGGPILPRGQERDDDVCCVGGDTVYELDQQSLHELTGGYHRRDSG